MKVGVSLIVFIAMACLLAMPSASARGFGGGTFGSNRFVVHSRPFAAPPPGRIIVERRVFVAPPVRHRIFVERPFPLHRRFVVVHPLIVAPPAFAAPHIVIVRPFSGTPR